MNDYPIVANAETIRLITFSASDPRRNPLASTIRALARQRRPNVGVGGVAEGCIPLSRMRRSTIVVGTRLYACTVSVGSGRRTDGRTDGGFQNDEMGATRETRRTRRGAHIGFAAATAAAATTLRGRRHG